jgi:hypothetical protein
MLRTILAETPLVQNLQNPHYMTILLNGKNSLEEYVVPELCCAAVVNGAIGRGASDCVTA